MRKPPALPMPLTGGGCTTKMSASWIAASLPNSAPVMAGGDGDAHHFSGEPAVAAAQSAEAPVEDLEEAFQRPLPPADARMGVMGLEQQRTHRRRQRQRHDERDHRGAGDGERKLTVELSRN